MIIFSNTTPFIALSAIQQLDLMPALFGKVYVVDSVINECAAGGAIQVTDLRKLSWITAVQYEEKNRIPLLVTLDLGERETIETALSHQADYVIIDEKLGRNFAEYLGLKVTAM